eukprot:2558602-Pleurochrysis_carterae.AAC.2
MGCAASTSSAHAAHSRNSWVAIDINLIPKDLTTLYNAPHGRLPTKRVGLLSLHGTRSAGAYVAMCEEHALVCPSTEHDEKFKRWSDKCCSWIQTADSGLCALPLTMRRPAPRVSQAWLARRSSEKRIRTEDSFPIPSAPTASRQGPSMACASMPTWISRLHVSKRRASDGGGGPPRLSRAGAGAARCLRWSWRWR